MHSSETTYLKKSINILKLPPMEVVFLEIMKKVTEVLVGIFFPANLNCIMCDMPISRKNRYSLCSRCADEMNFIQDACVICGKPILNLSLDEENYTQCCPYCKGKKFLFDRNISFIEYDEVSKNLIFNLKYRGKTYLSKIIAEIMYDRIQALNPEEFEKADFIMYVPLARQRQKERGFNQSEKIAEHLSRISEISLNRGIIRKRNTKKLHHIKSDGRKKELSGAFSIVEGEKENICGKNVILVDDIFTTGSTVNEISKELRLCGVERITVLTLLTGKYVKGVDKEDEIY